MTALQDLRERVGKATGPDREIDCYIEAFVSRFEPEGQFHIVGAPSYDPPRFFYNPSPSINWIGYDLLNISPAYTASIDAAMALIERVLPKAYPDLVQNLYPPDHESGLDRSWTASIYCPWLDYPNSEFEARAKTAPLALLSALLAAIPDQGDAESHDI